MVKENLKVIYNKQIAALTYEMCLETTLMAQSAKPGMFINISLIDASKLLKRPISICQIKDNNLIITYKINGEGVGKLIGFHGDTLHAIQLLLSGIKTRSEGPVRLYVDIAGYKANRNQSIIDLANKVAEQAIKIERNIHLDPMSAYDRRIVHTTLQDRDDVTTESTGEGEKRHVVVKPIFKR